MEELSLRLRVVEPEDLRIAQDVAATFPNLTTETTTGPPSDDFSGQLEPVTAILIGAGAVAVAKFILDWWQRRRGGLVIDLRRDAKDEIYRDPDVPFGFILVFPVDGGSVKIEAKEVPKDAMERLLESVISKGFGTVAELAEVASTIIGTQKVSTSPIA